MHVFGLKEEAEGNPCRYRRTCKHRTTPLRSEAAMLTTTDVLFLDGIQTREITGLCSDALQRRRCAVRPTRTNAKQKLLTLR